MSEDSSNIVKTYLFLLLAVEKRDLKKKKFLCTLSEITISKGKLLATIHLIIHPKLALIQKN